MSSDHGGDAAIEHSPEGGRSTTPIALDHDTDPVTRLRAAAATCAPGDRIVVEVANAASLDARLALLHGDGGDGPTAGRFTRRSLFAAAHDAGLVVTSFERVARRGDATFDAPLAPLVQDLVLLDPNAAAERFVATLELPGDASRRVAEDLERALTAEEGAAAAQIRTLVAAQQREQAELLQSRQELIAVQNGKLMRWSQFPRRVYRRLRRLVGR